MAAVSLAAILSASMAAPHTIEKINIYAKRHHFETVTGHSLQTDSIDVQSQSMAPRTIADLLQNTAGVTFNGQGGLFQSYSIRGFSKARIRSEIEGVPIYTDRRAGNSLSFLAPEFIDTINVEKGPSSALYGSDAMGGVISAQLNHHTQNSLHIQSQPSDSQASISYLYGSEFTSFGLSYRTADNAHAPNGHVLHTEYEQYSGYLKSEYQLDEWLATTSVLVSQSNDIGKSSALYPAERMTTYPSDLHSIILASLTNETSWYANLFHHYQNWDSDVTRPEKRRNETAYQSHTLGGLYYIYAPVISDNDRLGIDWVSRSGVKIDEAEYDSDNALSYRTNILLGSQDNIAVFAESMWQLPANLNLATGIRFDKFYQKNELINQSKHDEAVSGSISLNYSMDKNWSFSGELGTGFRMPTLSELYFNGETPRGSTLGNPNLAPEKNLGLAVSAAWQHKDLEIKTNLYRQNVDNYIERYRVSDELRSYRNLSNAHIQGLEIYLTYQQSEYISHAVSYQWQEGEDDNQVALADLNIPEVNYQIDVQYDQLSVHNTMRYRFEKSKTGDGEQQLDAVFLWDFKANWYLNESLSLTLSGLNLLNKEYRASADEHAALQPERRLSLGLNYQF